MELKKEWNDSPDLRVNLFLAVLSGVLVTIYEREVTFMAAFAVCVFFLLLHKRYKKTLNFVGIYLLLLFFGNLVTGIRAFQTLWLFSNVGRHLLIPLSFLSEISDRPAGMILEVFHRMNLPKSAGISFIVLMRFLPTIRYEWGAIRGALKFRGVGVSLWSTLLHLPKNFALTLIPLLIRTVRISDEITAAALTRGIELKNPVVSFSEVRWTKRDSVELSIFTAILILFALVEKKWGWNF